MTKLLIVTHHAPDIDAIGATWILKRFDAQHYADAKVAFVDPGHTIDPEEAERLGFQLPEVTHVDTGLGEFDHHQPDRGLLHISATSLVYDHVSKIHPELATDEALKELVSFIVGDDHFDEVNWPEPDSLRYCFMLPELLHGFESLELHDDDSQLHFGMQALDCAYAALKETIQAKNTIGEGQVFELPIGKCLGIETKNDRVVKYAQRIGFALVIRKDPTGGEVRIKARPDTKIDLKALSEKILEKDKVGSWYYHPSGKMLLNGSKKQHNQKPSPLTLQQVIEFTQEIYGK
jgi:hypothetical protein